MQGYALKQLIEDRVPGAQVDIVRYRSSKNIIYSGLIQQAKQYSPLDIAKKGFSKIFGSNKKTGKYLAERRRIFHAFMEEAAPGTLCYTDAMLDRLAEEYDILICGSDQVWNPNVARPAYFLKGVEGCGKIAYAASIARDDLSPKEREVMLPLIEKFDAVSVREKTAKDFLRRYMGDKREIHEVLDPALMRTREEWEQLCGPKEETGEKYALCFFFSDSLRYRKQIATYCKERNLTLKYIPFSQNKYQKSDLKGAGEALWDVGPREFLKLFQNAECVFTDSFHGSVFSLLFEKPFLVFNRDKAGKTSKNSRLTDLLLKFGLQDRLIQNKEFAPLMDKPMDFAPVREKLAVHRQASLEFLLGAIGKVAPKDRNIHCVDEMPNALCVGCGACQSLCPKGSIVMEQNGEGFLYPTVDRDTCISCGLCVKGCQSYQKPTANTAKDTYIGYNGDESIRKQSSSGGLFWEIASSILDKGGAVWGADYDGNFRVCHTKAENKEALLGLLGSKYVQSDMGTVYRDMETVLREGRPVLFSGTPCQAAAVFAYFDKKHLRDNLYLVDFICHGVPSPGVWESYVAEIGAGDTIQSIHFRDKEKRGWHDYHVKVEYRHKKPLWESHETNAFMRAFIGDQSLRPSCYECHYRGDNYFSDITLGDAWKIEKEKMEWADDKGTSVFVVRTEKGKQLFTNLPDTFHSIKSSYEDWCRWNPSLQAATVMPESRNAFFAAYQTKSQKEFWKQNKKIPLKRRVKYTLKKVARVAGLEKTLRNRQ